MKKKILITGANGLLGQKILFKAGQYPDIEWIATSRGELRMPLADGIVYESLNVENESEVNACIAKHKPEVIIHTAAMTHVDVCEQNKQDCWVANVEATAHLAKAAQKHQAYFLHLSTDFIFDGTKGPYKEEDPAYPVSFYGYSKLAAEELILKLEGLRYGIARTALVYGIAHDMSRSNIILWVKDSLEKGKKIKVVDDQVRSPTLAEDLADGCILMALQEAEGIYNIAGKDVLTPYDMAQKVIEYFHLDGSLVEKADSSTFTQPARRPPVTGFYIDKAVQNLGYKPHSFNEGIAEVARQMKLANAIQGNN